jgi:hypothetical protein
VSRVLRFDARYRRAAERLGIAVDSERGLAVGRTILALLNAEELPGPGDVVANIPPTDTALVRRVSGRNIWLWYRVESDAVVVRHVSTEPPIPIDE